MHELTVIRMKDGISSCKFPRHFFHCGIKNGNLEEPFFYVNIMMTLKDPQKLEFYEKYLRQNGYDTLNNSKFQ